MTRTTNKIALTIALILTVGISSSFAKTTNGNDDMVTASFRKDFKKGQLMNIEIKREYTKVTFTMGDQVMFAFYSGSGDLLAVTRNLLSSQLPIQLLMSLKQNYSNYWITDLFEVNSEDQTHYYVTLQNADGKKTLRAGNTEDWTTFHP